MPHDRRRVLYVEDNRSNVRLVQVILTRRPHIELLPAFNGVSAIEQATDDPPDLILLDLHLPDISGLEVLERLRADPATAEIPVIVLTADVVVQPLGEVYGRLEKPIDIAEFLAVVDRALDR